MAGRTSPSPTPKSSRPVANPRPRPAPSAANARRQRTENNLPRRDEPREAIRVARLPGWGVSNSRAPQPVPPMLVQQKTPTLRELNRALLHPAHNPLPQKHVDYIRKSPPPPGVLPFQRLPVRLKNHLRPWPDCHRHSAFALASLLFIHAASMTRPARNARLLIHFNSPTSGTLA